MPIYCTQFSIVFVGAPYVDTLLHVPEFPKEDHKMHINTVERRLGGNSVNTARALAVFSNVTCALVAAFPSLDASRFIQEELYASGIDISNVQYRKHIGVPPSSYIMCSSATSSRTITYTNPVPELSFDELWTTLAPLYHPASQSKVKWIHFEGRNPDTVVQVLQKIAQTDSDRIRLSVELEKPARTQLLQVESLADVVFYSQEWARHYGFTDAQAFLQSRASFAKPGAAMFCTWGADGAAVYDATTHQMSFAKPPVIARVQDTVGAGDTFNAGVLYAFSLHKTPKEAVEYGCRMAALKVSGIPAKELAQHFT